MARRLKIKLRMCCPASKTLFYAVPDSKSIRKLRTRYVKTTGGMSMDAPICHVPVGVLAEFSPVVVDYEMGEWMVRRLT